MKLLTWVGLIISAIGFVFRGYTLSVLWGWFIVPTFGLSPINLAAALGLLSITFLFGGDCSEQPVDTIKRDEEENMINYLIKVIGIGIASPAFALLAGWVVRFGMG